MYNFFGVFCLFWLFLLFGLQVLATSGLLQDTLTMTPNFLGTTSGREVVAPAAQFHHIQSRQQSAGSSCSQEGQWNCMTNSFQRCGAGQWSVVMQCAKGTSCSPSGLTMDFRVQHDGSVSTNNGGTPTTSVGSSSSSGTVAHEWRSKVVVGLGVVLSWSFC